MLTADLIRMCITFTGISWKTQAFEIPLRYYILCLPLLTTGMNFYQRLVLNLHTCMMVPVFQQCSLIKMSFVLKVITWQRMEVSDANLQTLAGYLQQTLSPDVAVRKQGRIFIHVELLHLLHMLLLKQWYPLV